MERNIILTEDGSHTLFVPELNEHFHSIHGAIQESMHVFILNGLAKVQKTETVIFEVGFGTGLNALLSLIHKGPKNIHYFSIEKYPLQANEFEKLNFAEQIDPELMPLFLKLHQCKWNKAVEIAPGFQLTKLNRDLECCTIQDLPVFDLIYFDAFAPGKQPGMWQEEIFRNLSAHTNPGGIFVTYCAQGEVRRRLTRSGYTMNRIPGPPGKKEMLFGQKTE